MTSAQLAFVDRAVAAARRVTPSTVPAYGPVAVAQAILESNFGKSAIGGYNLFGIKARAGEPSVLLATREFLGGKWVTVKAPFRRFDSLEEAFSSHRDLLLTRRWKAGGSLIYARALQSPLDPVGFARALTGVYATDPKYHEKLIGVMKAHRLPERMGFGPGVAQADRSPVVAASVATSSGGPRWEWLGAVALGGLALVFLTR